MKKAKNIKLVKLVITFGLLAAIFIPVTSTLAAENYYDYAFTIKAYQANTKSGGLYRETTNTSNRWRVSMYESTESSGKDITRFWLSGSDNTKLSPSSDVLEDNGPYYADAYSSASQRTVYLTAENNNYNANSYACYGYWDEETN